MAHRTIATIQRPAPHVYQPDKDTPGTCLRCHLVKANAVHVAPDDPRLAEQDQAQQEHRRRIGEQS